MQLFALAFGNPFDALDNLVTGTSGTLPEQCMIRIYI